MILQGIAPSQGEGLPLLNCPLPLKIDSRLALLVEVGFQFGEVLVSGRDRQSKMQHHETKQPNSSNKLLLFLAVTRLHSGWILGLQRHNMYLCSVRSASRSGCISYPE